MIQKIDGHCLRPSVMAVDAILPDAGTVKAMSCMVVGSWVLLFAYPDLRSISKKYLRVDTFGGE